ncbi:MAG TPA: YCF48-related protein, partial [Blastocatellia bacterium]|nr:YCF48-related protein [Blastocatellia bacterium]
PEAKTEAGPGSRPRRTSSAEPVADSPAPAEAVAGVTIGNDNWKVMNHGVEIVENLRAVYFLDSTTGWAAGDAGAVYRTTDGGRDWKPQSPGSDADINFIYFIDLNHGWALGKSGAKTSDANGGENVLFITSDGGRTWTSKPLPNVTGLHFINAKTGWAVGRNFTLLKTTDGGLEWSKVGGVEKLVGSPVESSNYDFGFSDIHFTDAKHGWLIANYYGQARNDIGGVFKTSDGGATWKRLPLMIQTRHNSGLFTPGLLHSANFTDANTGSITGEMYDGESRYFFALHTRDGGRTWSLFRIPSRATHISQFLDPARGWTAGFLPRASGDEAAAYDTTLLRTENGGLGWRIDLVARGRRIRGVFFLSPTKGWAVGDRGMILSYEEKEKSKVN